MFKLPVCPYCKTVYRYGDVKKSINNKKIKCYHCNKNFKVSKKGIAVWFALLVMSGAVINLLEMCIFKNIDFIALNISNVVVILVFLLFIPFFIRYKKTDNTDKDIPKKKRK